MPQVRLTVDGDLKFDFAIDLNAWQQQPPEALAELMKPEARNNPYNMATLAAIVDAVSRGADIDIDLTTESGGWSLSVRDWVAVPQ